MKKILFVCTGNICRSPTAEGVFRKHVGEAGLHQHILVDSAGTQGYHVGDAPDMRSIIAAEKRGYDIDGLRARKVGQGDFRTFDLILALDHTHLRELRRLAPPNATAELQLFLEYAGGTQEQEVPDPYYGNSQHFEYVLDLIESASKSLLQKIRLEMTVS